MADTPTKSNVNGADVSTNTPFPQVQDRHVRHSIFRSSPSPAHGTASNAQQLPQLPRPPPPASMEHPTTTANAAFYRPMTVHRNSGSRAATPGAPFTPRYKDFPKEREGGDSGGSYGQHHQSQAGPPPRVHQRFDPLIRPRAPCRCGGWHWSVYCDKKNNGNNNDKHNNSNNNNNNNSNNNREPPESCRSDNIKVERGAEVLREHHHGDHQHQHHHQRYQQPHQQPQSRQHQHHQQRWRDEELSDSRPLDDSSSQGGRGRDRSGAYHSRDAEHSSSRYGDEAGSQKGRDRERDGAYHSRDTEPTHARYPDDSNSYRGRDRERDGAYHPRNVEPSHIRYADAPHSQHGRQSDRDGAELNKKQKKAQKTPAKKRKIDADDGRSSSNRRRSEGVVEGSVELLHVKNEAVEPPIYVSTPPPALSLPSSPSSAQPQSRAKAASVVVAAETSQHPAYQPDTRLAEALNGLISQHQEFRSIGANAVLPEPRSGNVTDTAVDDNARRLKRGRKDYDDSDSSRNDSSSDSDDEPMSLDRIALLIEKQRSRFKMHTEEARRASRRMNKLTKRLSRIATCGDSSPMIRSADVGRSSPRSPQRALRTRPQEEEQRHPVPPTPPQIDTSSPTTKASAKAKAKTPKPSVPLVLKSSDKIDVLYAFNTTKAGDLGRKPRTLLLPPKTNGGLRHTVIASTLDGNLHLFDKRLKRHYQSIRHDELRNYWPEDIAWVSHNILAVAAADKSCHSATRGDERLIPHQLALIYDCSMGKGKMTYKVQHLIHNTPHDKGATVIYPFSLSGNKTHWLTGGLDKKLFLWSFDGKFQTTGPDLYTRVNHISVHTEHTSSINAIHYNKHSEILYSGGLDCRLVGWSITNQKNVLPPDRLEGRIRDLTEVPTQPNLMLIGFAENKRQLRLWDERTNSFVLEFGMGNNATEEPVRDSTRYMHPSVHPNGYLVSMGQLKGGKIGIWDMRYSGVERAPTQQIDGHSKRVIVAKFDTHKSRESLISISHDNSINFTDYKRRQDVPPQNPTTSA